MFSFNFSKLLVFGAVTAVTANNNGQGYIVGDGGY
jgi:hypothetical protein